MEITKLRLLKLKNGNGLELSYEEDGANGDKINRAGETHTAIIHNDLYNAVQALAVHLAIMAFHVKENEVEDIAMPEMERFKDFTVGSFSISGKDEKRGIIISGTLRKGGKAHNFNTPFYRFEEPQSNSYSFMDDLVAKIRVIESEVPAYLNGSKRGEGIQGALDLKDEKVTKMKIAEPVAGQKVTEEGNLAADKNKHKYADADAMQRVAEGDKEKPKGRRKVVQSADNPSGEAAE